MDCIWLVLSLSNAIKRNYYDRCKSAISRMPDLFSALVSYNKVHYLIFNQAVAIGHVSFAVENEVGALGGRKSMFSMLRYRTLFNFWL